MPNTQIWQRIQDRGRVNQSRVSSMLTLTGRSGEKSYQNARYCHCVQVDHWERLAATVSVDDAHFDEPLCILSAVPMYQA
jgi:hypothetical protein